MKFDRIHSFGVGRMSRGLLVPPAVVGLVAAALLLVACGGDSVSAYGESEAVTVEGDSVTVEMRNMQFMPQAIRVTPGTTVTWVNEDPVIHNVRQVQSHFLSPDVMDPGEEYSFTFEEPGSYRYQCTYHHPTMNGVVIVEAA